MLMANDLDEDGAGRDTPPSLEDFSQRLGAMRGEPEKEKPSGAGAGLGQALRLSSELLAGLLVGGALGYGLDRLLETSPWFLLAGIGVGFAAGVRNTARMLNKDNETGTE